MNVIEVNDNNFEKEVLESDKMVLIDFNANWCGPCRMLKPIIDEFAMNHDEIKVVSVNIDESEVLAEKYNVLSIPCLVLLDKGKEIKRSVGYISKDNLDEFIIK